jgi:transcriptional regulator with XRE-family HTH domain
MKLTSAVAELRKKLGDRQEAFAARLHHSVRTVARYESGRPPKGLALARFANIAQHHGLADLAEVFRGALEKEWGAHVLFDDAGRLYLEESFAGVLMRFDAASWKPIYTDRPRGANEYLWVNALLGVLRSDKHAQLRGKILSLLASPAKQWLEELHDGLALDAESVEKLLRKGKPPAEVAELLDLDAVEVERFWQWIQLSEAFHAKPGRKRP